VDIISTLQILDVGRIVLSAVHLAIGVSGIMILRRLPAG
jgi:hypothetical protein